MEVILREDVDKVGDRGQVVKVAAGYARNFLLPKRLAVPATEANKKIVEQEKQSWLKREAKAQGESEELAEALEKKGFSIDRRKIQLDEPIKSLGEFNIPVKLHRAVTVNLNVHVVREG
jgi:large subunit ribosomal protein L9